MSVSFWLPKSPEAQIEMAIPEAASRGFGRGGVVATRPPNHSVQLQLFRSLWLVYLVVGFPYLAHQELFTFIRGSVWAAQVRSVTE